MHSASSFNHDISGWNVNNVVTMIVLLHLLIKIFATTSAAPLIVSVSNTHNTYKNQGIIILGMHRSGTSVVGGLMNAMGLNTGGSLIRPGNDNEKGFF